MEFNLPRSIVDFSLREAIPHDAEYIPSETLEELRSIQSSYLRLGLAVRLTLGLSAIRSIHDNV